MPATSGVWDQVAGKWKDFTGHVKQEWGKLTDDDMMQNSGDKDRLAGKIQERYGITKEDAHAQIEKWSGKLDNLTK